MYIGDQKHSHYYKSMVSSQNSHGPLYLSYKGERALFGNALRRMHGFQYHRQRQPSPEAAKPLLHFYCISEVSDNLTVNNLIFIITLDDAVLSALLYADVIFRSFGCSLSPYVHCTSS